MCPCEPPRPDGFLSTQALAEGKIVKVRTNYRISPDHAKALNLPAKPSKSRRKSSTSTSTSTCTSEGKTTENSGGTKGQDRSIENGAGVASKPAANVNTYESSGDGDSHFTADSRAGFGADAEEVDGTEDIGGDGDDDDDYLVGRSDSGGGHGGGGGGGDPTAVHLGEIATGGVDNDAAAAATAAAAAAARPDSPPNAGAVRGAAEEQRQKPVKAAGSSTGRAKGRPPKAAAGGESGTGSGNQDLVEDEVLHAEEEEFQAAAAVAAAAAEEGETVEAVVPRPQRPVPVHRLQVPAETVGDLLTVWDFLKVRGELYCASMCVCVCAKKKIGLGYLGVGLGLAAPYSFSAPRN